MPAPRRPSPRTELFASRLFLALAPRLPKVRPPGTPGRLAPFEELVVGRRRGRGGLTATWYPADATPRGAVLLLHPWLVWGRAYFHRRGRIEALRGSGYHALAMDLPGFGGSGPPAGFHDAAIEEGLALLRRRSAGLPLHLWGVSSGGYWAHPALTRTDEVAGAMFEDVSPHLIEWSARMAPRGAPAYALFRHLLKGAYRFLDLVRQAPFVGCRAVSYLSGAEDPGVRPEETRALAAATGGRCRVVPEAGHLGAIKVARAEVIDLALDTFARAVAGPAGPAA